MTARRNSSSVPAITDATLLVRVRDLARSLQDRITSAFEEVEGGTFVPTPWSRPAGGGGEMRVLRGRVIEKAGVNVSHVWGPSNPFTGNPFDATGLSVIAHPANPKAPAVHLNVRAFAEYKAGEAPVADSSEPRTPHARWVGGGMDLTPMGFPFTADTTHFHEVCRRAIDRVDSGLYERFTKQAAEYFFVPHRNRERGVGGIFFDQEKTLTAARSFALVESVATYFLDAYLPILVRRIGEPFTEKDRDTQLQARATYAEFNLLYDKGTRFGFESGGNPDAILASMPPLVKW